MRRYASDENGFQRSKITKVFSLFSSLFLFSVRCLAMDIGHISARVSATDNRECIEFPMHKHTHRRFVYIVCETSNRNFKGRSGEVVFEHTRQKSD